MKRGYHRRQVAYTNDWMETRESSKSPTATGICDSTESIRHAHSGTLRLDPLLHRASLYATVSVAFVLKSALLAPA
jgi:hypothetical protein